MNQYHEEEILGKAYDGRLARRLLTYLYPYRRVVGTSIFLLVIISALRLVGPYLTLVAIDRYVTTGEPRGLPLIALLFPKPDRYRIGARRAWMWVTLAGLATAGAIYCRVLSIALGDVSIVFTLIQTSPLFVVIISAVFLRELERITRQVVFGAVLTVAGGIVVSVF